MIFKVRQYMFNISLLSPPGKGHGPSFEQIWVPITQGCFVPSLVEIGPVVLMKKIFKFWQCNFAISLLSPLGKGRSPSFEEIWIPITQGCFVPSFVEIGPVVLEKKSKIGKVYRRTDRQTDGQTDRRLMTGDQKSSRAKNDVLHRSGQYYIQRRNIPITGQIC